MSAPVFTTEEDVRGELTARFLNDLPLGELAHVALGLAVTIMLVAIDGAPVATVALWFVTLVVMSGVRYRVRKSFAKRGEQPTEIPWPVVLSIVAVGLVWSAGAMPILLGDDREMISFVMIVECGLAAAATFTFAATITGFRVFMASIFVPLVVGIFGNGVHRYSVIGAILVIVFGGVMFSIHRRGCAQLTRSLQMHSDLDRSRMVAEAGQTELRENEQRLFQFLESMPVGVVVMDKTRKVYFSNAAAVEMVGGWIGKQPTFEEQKGQTSAYVPGTQTPIAMDRSPISRALAGENSVDQVEILGPTGLRLMEIHGSPIRDGAGEVAYAVAVLSDLSGRQSGDQRRAAMNAVLGLTAEATSEEQLLSGVLKLLNERFGFSLAELWMSDGQSTVLRRVGSSQRDPSELIAGFDRASARLSFRKGEGLPGAVWKTGEPLWRKRLAEDDRHFLREGGSVEAGLRTAVSVPVFVAGVASGALVMFATEPRDPDTPVTETLMAIGAQVGGAIGRRRADARLRAAEERYRQLVEASTDLVWEVDLDGRWTFVNAASQRLYGMAPSEMVGRPYAERVDPRNAAADREMFSRLAGGEIITEYETVHRDAKDAPIVISTSATPVRDPAGKIVGYHGIIRDVGDRAATRAALRAARDTAEQAASAKSAFLANMSHEIRTPMNGVLGIAELLQGSDLDADQRRMVDLIRTSGNSLLTVINEILDFSKIEAHQLEIESVEFDLHDVVTSMVKVLASSSTAPDVEIVTDIGNDVPTHVMGDPMRLRQVLSNLLGNAIKFTHEGEVVTTVERIAGVGKVARLSFAIRDTGIGMSPDTLAAIFEPFRQADSSTTRRYGGTGLGLSISRRLVELMGGHLIVTSAESEGSRFSFELFMPIVPEPAKKPDASLEGIRVLVVDDNATNQRVMRGMLSFEGTEVDVVADGATGLRMLRNASDAGRPYAVLVTDVQMPEMDGFELVRELRMHSAVARTPVVMATSGNRRGDVARSGELGIAAVLIKPVSRREITKAIQAALSGPHPVTGEHSRKIAEAKRKLVVLIAEDNAINQEVAKAMLIRRGHDVDVVADGRAAVNAALAKDYDVILMDIQMPELDGLDASREIRKHRPAPRPRIVALTANVLPGERERCLAGGMDAYLAKPFAAADLFAVLEGDAPVSERGQAAGQSSVTAIDLAALRSDLQAAGIEETLPVLVELFLRDGPGRIDAITAAAKAKKGIELASASHALKSSAGALRATRLMTLLGAIEKAAKGGDVAGAVQQVDAVVAEHRAVHAWLETGAWRTSG